MPTPQMRERSRCPLWGVWLVLLVAVAPARSGAATTYDGHVRLSDGRLGGATASLDFVGPRVTGTLTLTLPDPRAGGDYRVAGRMRGRRITANGKTSTRIKVQWKAARDAGAIAGTVRLRGRGVRLRGQLELAERVSASTGCDDYFRGEVMSRVLLPVCSACHASGGQADGTRLQVVAGDVATTRANVGLVIDTGDPAASPLVVKPVGGLSHGGGAPLAAGGAELGILQHWVELVAGSECGSVTPPGNGGNDPGTLLYGDKCASCHGLDARGVAGRPSIWCNRDVSDPVKVGRPGPTAETTMRPFPLLTDADIALLQGYLDALCPTATATGAELFAGNCASCHGADAAGTGEGPAIRCSRSIRHAVRNGVVGAHPGRMPALTRLTDAEIERIQSHLTGLCPSGTATNAELFAANCAACHGTSGEGNGTRPDVRCTVSSRLHDALLYGRGFPVSLMPSYLPALSAGEVTQLAAFLAPRCGGRPVDLYVSNCATCHGATGQGGTNADGLNGPGIRCRSSGDLTDAIQDGSGGMPALADMTTQQIGSVVTYLRSGCP